MTMEVDKPYQRSVMSGGEEKITNSLDLSRAVRRQQRILVRFAKMLACYSLIVVIPVYTVMFSKSIESIESMINSIGSEFDSNVVKTFDGNVRNSGHPDAVSAVENIDNSKEDVMHPKLTMYGSHKVKSSTERLPRWLQEYFAWHRDATQHADKDTKYIVLPCIGSDKCGGFSDRLRALPFMLLIASRLDRVFCIYWNRPFGLEEFFQSPEGGIDWRCPDEYIESVKDARHSGGTKYRHYRSFAKGKTPIVESAEEGIRSITAELSEHKFVSMALYSNEWSRMNDANKLFQMHSYNERMPDVGHWDHVELMGDIFRVLFEPKDEIAERVNATMQELGLVENNYSSIHIRARYPAHKLEKLIGSDEALYQDLNGGLEFRDKVKEYLIKLYKNSLQCAYLIASGSSHDVPGHSMPLPSTIYFASDHNDFTDYVISHDTEVSDGTLIRPVGLSRSEILHSEGKNYVDKSANDYYPIIEDLLIMGGSKCVVHGIGSFGAFGAALSGNKCRAVHRKYNGDAVKCPNERGDRIGIPIDLSNMLHEENSGTGGKIEYGEDMIANST